jgi:hypothetical protein
MVSKKAIQEFKDIYLKEYGVELSDKEALELGTRLLLMFKAIYRPVEE